MTMNRRTLFASSCAHGGPDRLSAFESQGWVTIKDSLGNLLKSIKASVYSSIHRTRPHKRWHGGFAHSSSALSKYLPRSLTNINTRTHMHTRQTRLQHKTSFPLIQERKCSSLWRLLCKEKLWNTSSCRGDNNDRKLRNEFSLLLEKVCFSLNHHKAQRNHTFPVFFFFWLNM